MHILQYKTGLGTGKTFIFDGRKTVYQSSDGYEAFTQVTGTSNQAIQKHWYALNDDRTQVIVWGDDYGDNLKLAHSSDGINWTEFNVGNLFQVNGVTWNDGAWFVAGLTNLSAFEVYTSTNGTGWTKIDPLLDFTGAYNPEGTDALVSTGNINDEMLLGADDGGPGIIAAPSDGGIWQCPVCPNGCDIPNITNQARITVMTRTSNTNTYVLGLTRGAGPVNVHTSHDGGCTWQARSPLTYTGSQTRQVFSGDTTTIFAVTNNPASEPWRVGRSTDNGLTWTDISSVPLFNGSLDSPFSYIPAYGWLYVNGAADDTWRWSTDAINWQNTNISSPSATGRIGFTMSI